MSAEFVFFFHWFVIAVLASLICCRRGHYYLVPVAIFFWPLALLVTFTMPTVSLLADPYREDSADPYREDFTQPD